jgi:hypothetical protein
MYNSQIGWKLRSKSLVKEYLTEEISDINEIKIYEKPIFVPGLLAQFSFDNKETINRIVKEKHAIQYNCEFVIDNKEHFSSNKNNDVRKFHETVYEDYQNNKDVFECYWYDENNFKADFPSKITSSKKLMELAVNTKNNTAYFKVGKPVSF